MRISSFTTLTAALLASALAVALTGCGEESPSAGPMAPTGPTLHEVTVTIGAAIVIASCEGSATNPGDFTWELIVRDSELDPADYPRFNGSFSGLSGQTVDIPDVVFTMDREAKSKDGFSMEFHVTEWDGANVWDDRMADSIGEHYHGWQGGTDWGNGPQTVLVAGATECRVNMVYSVAVK